MTWLARWHYW